MPFAPSWSCLAMRTVRKRSTASFIVLNLRENSPRIFRLDFCGFKGHWSSFGRRQVSCVCHQRTHGLMPRIGKPEPPKLKIGSFSVTSLGGSRIPTDKVMRQLSAVICTYDVISIQGIRDTRHGNLADQLLQVVNTNGRCQYTYSMSVSSSMNEAGYDFQSVSCSMIFLSVLILAVTVNCRTTKSARKSSIRWPSFTARQYCTKTTRLRPLFARGHSALPRSSLHSAASKCRNSNSC